MHAADSAAVGEDDFAFARPVQRRQSAQQRRLAAAVRADKRGDRTGVQCNRRTVHGAVFSVVERDIARVESWARDERCRQLIARIVGCRLHVSKGSLS